MKTLLVRIGFLAVLLSGFIRVVSPQPAAAQASSEVERGAYLVSIAGCPVCHSPFKPEYSDLSKLSLDQIKVLAYDEDRASDTSRLMAGGRVFDLGPAGFVISANLTPDVETGIGGWTDDQVKIAIRTGLTPEGRVLFPLMPYASFNNLSDEDLNAIVAYLRTLPAVKNQVPLEGQVSTEGMQPLTMQFGVPPVDSTDRMARGKYLVNVVMDCNSCHTPLDPATGRPRQDLYLAGGQPYEGPWGIVYGGNITPDEATGLGKWSKADRQRAIITGVRPDGRRLAVMPWGTYSHINSQDLDALVTYLTEGVPAVSNEVPQAVIAEGMEMTAPVPVEESTPAAKPGGVQLWLAALGGVAVGAGIIIAITLATQNRKKPAK